ncbi:MAG: DUF177 domain-containing protein [Richelia sp.]|nr:DUF177 domain-containing protein [Richelia sp.]CDN11132.1 FIG057954: metal-binding, possibly nucleic acid-binding protein [Richelia intracellularis]
MDAIFIPQLTKASERTEEIQVQEFLPNLETLTPVRGLIRIKHSGNYLEVSGKVETIITFSCNRCLQSYNHRLTVQTSEIIWLEEVSEEELDLPLEREVSVDDLVETLSPQGYFEPSVWLYEQMCLEIPQRQLCDADCTGIQATNSDVNHSVDSRWASLESLKKKFTS